MLLPVINDSQCPIFVLPAPLLIVIVNVLKEAEFGHHLEVSAYLLIDILRKFILIEHVFELWGAWTRQVSSLLPYVRSRYVW